MCCQEILAFKFVKVQIAYDTLVQDNNKNVILPSEFLGMGGPNFFPSGLLPVQPLSKGVCFPIPPILFLPSLFWASSTPSSYLWKVRYCQ